MKHKRDKHFIEAIPVAWRNVPIGTVCRTRSGRAVIYAGVTGGRERGALAAGVDDGEWTVFPYSDLTPVKQWEPKEGEVVAVGGYKQVLITTYVGRGRYKDLDSDPPVPDEFPLYRIPEDFKLTRETLAVKWWIANGEKYEVGDE